jgi:DegV family protein with EDD domain
MDYVIMTDTSANLSRETILHWQLPVIPFTLCMDGKELPAPCHSDFNATEFYDGMRAGKTVTTSQINTRQFMDYMESPLLQGKDLLYIGMSSGISGSFHCAEQAAEELRSAYPERTIITVDTLGASLGEGLLVLKALEWQSEGCDLHEVASRLDALRHRMYQVFTVDDLHYLHKGGRLSGTATFLGTALGIKPILVGDSAGRIVSHGKCRGRKKSVEILAERYDQLISEPENQTVGIAHADCAEDAEYLCSLLRQHKPPKEILTVMYEPVTGCHVGPGTLALFFFGSDGVRVAAH